MTQTPPEIDLQSLQVPPKSPNSPQLSRQTRFRFEDIYVIERISQILAPYFVVIIGLFIYDKSFLLGTALIVIGLLVLFKISWEKIGAFVEGILSIGDRQ